MKPIRDFVILACAVVSTACLVYIVVSLESVKSRIAVSLSADKNDPAAAILDRLKK